MAFLNLIGADPARFPFITYIESTFPNGRVSGSGTLISPTVILTAGHIVYDGGMGGRVQSVDVRFGDGRWFTTAEVDFPVEWRNAAAGSFENSTVSNVDIGVIVLPIPVDQYVTPVRYQTASDSMLAAMSINVSGFPTIPPEPPGGARGDWLCGRNCNLLQGDELAALGFGGHETYRLFYPVETLPGMSGGPVYDYDPTSGRTVRGVHTSGPTAASPSFPGSALRITTGIFQLIQEWVSMFQP